MKTEQILLKKGQCKNAFNQLWKVFSEYKVVHHGVILHSNWVIVKSALSVGLLRRSSPTGSSRTDTPTVKATPLQMGLLSN